MTARVRVTCGTCGDRELPIDDVLLVLDRHSEVLRFSCPACGREQASPLDRRGAQLLTQSGVSIQDSVSEGLDILHPQES